MKLIGSSSQSPLSWLIRKICGEPITHVSIAFDDIIIFHSTPIGTNFKWLSDFTEKNKIHKVIELPLNLEDEEEIFFTIISKRKKRKYDWLGIMFQGVMRIRKIIFRIPIPTKNLWQSGNKDYCVEVLKSVAWDSINPGLQIKFDKIELEMLTPLEALIKIEEMIGEIK